MNTYLLYLRFQLLRGTLSAAPVCDRDIARARERSPRPAQPHWQRVHRRVGRERADAHAAAAQVLAVSAAARICRRAARTTARPTSGRAPSRRRCENRSRMPVLPSPDRRSSDGCSPYRPPATRPPSAKCALGGAVVGAVRQIFLRPAAEFGIGEHQRVVPLARVRRARFSARRCRRPARPAVAPASRPGRCACRSRVSVTRTTATPGLIGDDLAAVRIALPNPALRETRS